MPNWFDKALNKLKNYGGQIDKIELNVFSERQKFIEVFERNLTLEKEIAERTEELSRANKSILTIKHIWGTMNSAEPLSEVLSTVANGLADDLGYLHCFIYQVVNEENGAKLKVRAEANNNFASKIQEILDDNLESFNIPFDCEDNILIDVIQKSKISFIKSFKKLFVGCQPEIDPKKLDQLDEFLGNRSISLLPITVQGNHFGCLAVISIRKEITDTERNFLTLFTDQIELAVTIAGLFEKIRDQAITDGLTGLYNRRYFDQCLVTEVDRALRLKQPFTLISLDLDHLKQINDTFGHGAGDAAICNIGKVLMQNARSVDIPSRFGGEEFSVLLPGIDVEGGIIAAERLRAAIEAKPVEGVGVITASIGVATFLRHADTLGDLLDLVDQAMYRAKRNGRNQVQVANKNAEGIDWQQMALDAFMDILARRQVPVPHEIAKELVTKLKSSTNGQKDPTDLLYYIVDSLINTYDPMYPRGNTRDKIEIASKIAEKLKLSREEIDKIRLAMLLCDLGNLMLPEQILLKPGPLTTAERKKVSEHPIIAAREILKPIKSASPILNMVEHHHERWNGSGYPEKLSGNDIPIGSRIISIVDAYFAMVCDRPYRKSLAKEEAIKILKKGANNEWDGKLVEIFIDILQKEKKPV